MSWMEALARTYDHHAAEIGKIYSKKLNIKNKEVSVDIMLLPISHLTINAEIEIELNEAGEFLGAVKIPKESQVTLVPVTEDSAARSNGNFPMPLCDKLSYLSGDYDQYSGETKRKAEYYQAYMKNLHDWTDLPDTPVKVKAICRYLDKAELMKDIISLDLYDKKDVFVRFKVIDQTSAQAEEICTWKDHEIIDSFIQYYQSKLNYFDIDYITGETCAVTQKLPSKIRNSGDKSKLISSNDTSNFTFRGRFANASEAASVGYETSQKAHNALRWLIAKQGYKNGSESIICWETGGGNLPELLSGSEEICEDYEEYDDIDFPSDTAEGYAKKLNAMIAGYQQKLEENSQSVVMAVDTADGSFQGRLAITYYQQVSSSRLLQNILKWHKECAWELRKKNEENDYVYGSPSPKEIILTAYGTERAKILDIDEKVLKKNIDRILPCIAQGSKFPRDIMLSAVRNVGSPQRYSGFNLQRILANTCALIIKCQHDYGKEVFSMALNKENTDRDYLFGRLLAVTNYLEDYVNYLTENTGRETNAFRYWSVFAQRPAATYKLIRENLNSYIIKLRKERNFKYHYCLSLLEEIFDKLEDNGYFNNHSLKENYLLGYYSQMADLRSKKSKDDNSKEEN